MCPTCLRSLAVHGQIKSLELRLKITKDKSSEASRAAAEELTARVSAFEQVRAEMKAAASKAEQGEACIVYMDCFSMLFIVSGDG